MNRSPPDDLKNEHELVVAAVEASPTGLLAVGTDGRILLANPQLERTFRYDQGELVGQPVEQLLPVASRRDHEALRRSFFRQPISRPMGEGRHLRGLRKDGSSFPVEIGLSAVETDRGSIAIAAVTDITERQAAELALATAKGQAERANRAKGEFLGTISHELRTPLNAIIGFANLLFRNKPGNLLDEQRRYLGRIATNGRELLALISSLLDLAKIDSGELDIQLQATHLRVVALGVIEDLQSVAAIKGLELHAELPVQMEPIEADPRRLRQVLFNLVGNAIKFTETGRVSLRIAADGQLPRSIEVIDTGLGIPAAKQSEIFETFRQLDTGASRQHEGSGLGLAIAMQLCQRMGMELQVDSGAGVGSVFRIVLPTRYTDNPHSVARRDPEVERSPAKRPTDVAWALVVDDHLDAAEIIAAHLHDLGWNTTACTNADRAIELAKRLRPMLVTVDLLMPMMSGWEVIKRVRSEPDLRETSIIVISQIASSARPSLAADIACVDKPVVPDDLARAIRELTGGAIAPTAAGSGDAPLEAPIAPTDPRDRKESR